MPTWINFCDDIPKRRGWYLHRRRGKLHVVFVYETSGALPQLVVFQPGNDSWYPVTTMDGAWLGPVDLKEVEKLALR